MSTPPVSPRATTKTAPAPSPNRRNQSVGGGAGFPFPSFDGASNSPRRPGSSSRAGVSTNSLRPRRGSNASSILSVDSRRAGSVAGPGTETITEAGSNAISALLQPPIIRTGLLPHTHAPSGVRPPSTRDIPPVTLTTIPHVEPSSFNSYIHQAGSLYNALRRAREEQAGERRQSLGKRRDSELSNDGVEDGRPVQYHGVQRRPSSTAVTPSISVPPTPAGETPSLRRKGSNEAGSTPRRRPGLTVAPLNTIPAIYFDEDFRLENPRTFDVVSEKSEIVRQPAEKESNGSAGGGSNGLPPLPGGGDAGVGGRKVLAANAILQEKLSWYMDTVEIHLIQSISTASTSFFDALKELRDLRAEAEASVKQIKVLREDLTKLDEDMAVGGLEVVAMKRKRDNLRQLGNAVKQLETVTDGFARCEEHIGKEDVERALDELDGLESLIAGEEAGRKAAGDFKGPLIDLRGLKALETAPDDIAFLRKQIGSTVEKSFIAILLGDLRQHVDKVPASDTFRRWDQSSSRRRGQHMRTPSGIGQAPAYMDIQQDFRDELRTQLKGLAKAGTIMPTTSTYREAVQKEFKKIIQRHLPSSTDEDAESVASMATTTSRRRGAGERSAQERQDRSATLARNLRALEPEDAEAMFRNIYSNIGEALRRLSTQVKVLLDITSSLSTPPPSAGKSPNPRTPGPQTPGMSPRIGATGSQAAADDTSNTPLIPQEEIQQVLDLSSLLGQVVDVAQNQITKLLKVRTEQSSSLEAPFFLRYFTLNRLFADECEAVSGRSGVSLKTVVHDHIKSFVQNAGDAEKQALVRKMDADVWNARDFGPEEKAMLKAVTDASTHEIEDWIKVTALWSDDAAGTEATKSANGLGINVLSPSAPKENGELSTAQKGADNTETPATTTAAAAAGSKAVVRAAELDEQSFLLPSSAIAALSGTITYLKLVMCIPALAPDISISLLDFLRVFNSRAQQLILGAGATRSAGLQNITTKHLALSSQALSFVAALVPYIRECVRRYLPTQGTGSGVLADFDKVKRSLQDHQAGIVDKLVEIMQGRAVAHVVSFKKTDWERSDAGTVGTYMETLAKETTMLQKVLMRHLPEVTVRGIMVQVMEGYREVWGRAFDLVEVRSQGAKDRLKRDAEYFKARIGRLEGARDIGDHVLSIVEKKEVVGEKKKSTTAPAAATTASETAAVETKSEGKEEESSKKEEAKDSKDGKDGDKDGGEEGEKK